MSVVRAPLSLAAIALSAAAALSSMACSSTSAQYCEVAAECDEGGLSFDPVGSSDDSAAVCTAENETTIDALNANSEEECKELARLLQAYQACVVEEGCDAFDLLEPECKDEFEDYFDAAGDVQNRCNE